MRRQKRKILVDEAAGNAEALQADQIRLQIQRQEYVRFSKAAGLRTQTERAEAVNFGWKQAGAVSTAYDKVANAANAMYNIGSEEENVKAYMRDLPIRRQIRSDPAKLAINPEKQARHIKGSDGYIPGRSYVTVDNADLQAIVYRYAGTGEIMRS